MNLEDFKPTIAGILVKLKVPSAQKEDMAQECYIELLEKQEMVAAADFPYSYAESLCKNRIFDIWRAQERKIPTESLSDPRVLHKAAKVPIYEQFGVSDESMQEALSTLSADELAVVDRLYVQGYSRFETAAVLNIHLNTVDNRVKSAVVKLKIYFGVV
jgi:RNA polymerase sigma factor (sigma-70 family)